MFQAVPLDPTEFAASRIGKALYIYKPGIAAEHGAYFDTDADGRIDRAKVTFRKDLPRLPQSVTLYAPYDKSESVVVTPRRLSERVIVLDFANREFSRQVTGFDTGMYGKINDDAEGFFNPDPFPIADSVAPVILSAAYTMVGEPDGVSYNDSLTVVFSEDIVQSGTDPFVYFGTNPPIGLTQIRVEGNRLRAIVPVPASDKSNTLQPGDSIAIRAGAGNSIGDTKGNNQTNPDNIRVPVRIVPPSDFFRLRSGPTLFDPSQRQFMVSIAPNERISVLDHESKGTITIYDGVGNVVLSEPLNRTQKSLQYIWTGHNHNGRLVGQGTYVVVIEFTMSGMSAKKKMKVGVKR